MAKDEGTGTDQDVRRSLVSVGPDGVEYLILAAKRGVPFRAGSLDGSSVGDSIIGSIAGWIGGQVLGAIADARVGDSAPWKLGIVRQRGFPQRIKRKEVLPVGVDPAERMAQIAAHISAGTLT